MSRSSIQSASSVVLTGLLAALAMPAQESSADLRQVFFDRAFSPLAAGQEYSDQWLSTISKLVQCGVEFKEPLRSFFDRFQAERYLEDPALAPQAGQALRTLREYLSALLTFERGSKQSVKSEVIFNLVFERIYPMLTNTTVDQAIRGELFELLAGIGLGAEQRMQLQDYAIDKLTKVTAFESPSSADSIELLSIIGAVPALVQPRGSEPLFEAVRKADFSRFSSSVDWILEARQLRALGAFCQISEHRAQIADCLCRAISDRNLFASQQGLSKLQGALEGFLYFEGRFVATYRQELEALQDAVRGERLPPGFADILKLVCERAGCSKPVSVK